MGSETGSKSDMVKVTPGPSRTVTPSRTGNQFYNTTHSKYSTLDQIQENKSQGSQSSYKNKHEKT